MPQLQLPYDRSTLEFSLPDKLEVKTILPRPVEPIEDPRSALLDAMASPVGTRPLDIQLAGFNGRILILVSDHTRVSGKERVLPWLLDYLNNLGVPDSRIEILMALGSHTPPDDDKFRATIGPAIDRVKVHKHDPENNLIDCGKTTRRTPVRINGMIRDFDLIIPYTSIVHHYFAGFGGGRKIFLPGIASLESIAANHSLVFEGTSKSGGRNPLVFSGSLDGNPVHEDMLEASRLTLGDTPCFSIATVLTPDRQFGFFKAGDLNQTHRMACDFANRVYVINVESKADVIIASAGGYPKDTNVIQSHKGMDNVIHVLKPGGTLVYLMSCSDGYGHAAITDFAPLELKAVRTRLAENYIVYGQTVYALKEKARDYKITLVTGLPSDFADSLGMRHSDGLEEALASISPEIETAQLVYHVPRADITLPRCFPDH